VRWAIWLTVYNVIVLFPDAGSAMLRPDVA